MSKWSLMSREDQHELLCVISSVVVLHLMTLMALLNMPPIKTLSCDHCVSGLTVFASWGPTLASITMACDVILVVMLLRGGDLI